MLRNTPKNKTQLPAPYMWQQKTRQQPKITKKPFASNELLVIQDLSLESLHDLRSHEVTSWHPWNLWRAIQST